LREIEEWSALGNRDIDGQTREVAGERWEGSESKRLLAGTARGIGGCQRGKARAFATRERRADRDFRHHPEASEDVLTLPSSLFLSQPANPTSFAILFIAANNLS
jgi:hypothetical protein